jgi:hypothetical protein
VKAKSIVTGLSLMAAAMAAATAAAQPPTSTTVWTWCSAAYPGDLAPVWVQVDARRPNHTVTVTVQAWTPDGARHDLASFQATVEPDYPVVLSVADYLPAELTPGDYTVDATVTDPATGESLRHASTITVLDPATPGQSECND